MSENPPGRKRKPSHAREVPAAEFKATCLELMNKVKATGAEYVITKHGKAVAKLVPCAPAGVVAALSRCAL